MEFDSLGGGEEFDGDDLADVFGDGIEFATGKCRHADMVFLVCACGEGIDASGVGVGFVFADECGGSDVGDHETTVEAGVGGEESRESAEGAVNEEGDAAFGKSTDFGASDGEGVGGEGNGFGVEVSAAEDVASIGEYKRVISNAVRFGV